MLGRKRPQLPKLLKLKLPYLLCTVTRRGSQSKVAMRAFAALFALTSAVVGQQRPCPQAGATRDTIVRPAFPPAPATGVGSAGDIAGALARARGEASTSTRPHADGGVAATAAAASVAPLRAMIANTTECKAALLMYELALALLPARAPLAEAFEALRLDVDCGAPAPPPRAPGPLRGAGWTAGERAVRCLGGEVTVDATAGVDARGRGARDAPLRTIRAAVDALRASRHASIPVEPACVVLRGGTHFVGDTIALGAADSAVSFVADADDSEPAWVSGGVALEGLGAWQQRGAAPDGSPIWAASLPDTLDVITAMPSLNTLAPLNRLTNSQFPNYDVETDSQEVAGPWGGGGAVSEWVKPALYPLPTVLWKDLSGLKNDSTMDCYNHYSTGTGGPCDHWKGDMGGSGNYYCGNSSDGGWVEVDANMQKSGLLLFPMAAKLNMSVIADDYSGKNFDAWKIPPFKSFTGTPVATLTVWQGAPGGGGEWYNNRFVITDYDTATSVMNLSADGIWPSGGWQGGRVWHTLDAPQNKHDGPLIGGPWHVNGIASELDVQGEYFFDAGARELLFIWNTSLLPPGQAPLPPSSPPPASLLFVAPQTEVFFNVTGTPTAPVRDVSFVGLGFRDQRDGFLEPWCNPGSGDWALRRAGAITLRGTERALVSGCAFVRTDGNAVHVDKYARNTTIEDTEFVWLGMSAVTLMGDTEEDDATAATQPWGTVLSRNLVHEIGILEKQSSALFLGKSALTRVEHCVFFNGPRAMINFNDYTGGGDNVTSNAIWNTCRESGDHGPLNSE